MQEIEETGGFCTILGDVDFRALVLFLDQLQYFLKSFWVHINVHPFKLNMTKNVKKFVYRYDIYITNVIVLEIIFLTFGPISSPSLLSAAITKQEEEHL